MARTIRTKVYKFNELNETAQQKAIEGFRSKGMDTDFIYDEAHKTVKEFHDIFGTKEGRNSWLDVSTSQIDDNILELKGLRLQKYIWNNYKTALYKGKYFSLWSKTEKSYKHYKDGYPVLKSRYSKVILDNCCTLTGVCYDYSLLQPIYDFLERYNDKADYYSYMDFDTLINDCFASLEKDVENEAEAQDSDECITEHIEANEYEFTADGRRF
jgi:hypothetical protein